MTLPPELQGGVERPLALTTTGLSGPRPGTWNKVGVGKKLAFAQPPMEAAKRELPSLEGTAGGQGRTPSPACCFEAGPPYGLPAFSS